MLGDQICVVVGAIPETAVNGFRYFKPSLNYERGQRIRNPPSTIFYAFVLTSLYLQLRYPRRHIQVWNQTNPRPRFPSRRYRRFVLLYFSTTNETERAQKRPRFWTSSPSTHQGCP